MSAVQISTKVGNCVLRCSTHFVYVRTHCRIQVESGTHGVIRNPRLLSRGTTIGTINRRLCEKGYRRNVGTNRTWRPLTP